MSSLIYQKKPGGYQNRVDAAGAITFNALDQRVDDAFVIVEGGLLGVNVKHSMFAGGAKGDGVTNDGPAIQAAIDFVDTYNGGDPNLGSSYGSGSRGGMVIFPGTNNAQGYLSLQSIYTDARIRLVGVNGAGAGGVSSKILASASGDYTNGPFTEKWLVKVGRRSTGGYWWHSGTLENMHLDCAQVTGLGGMHCWGAGENSIVDNVQIENTGWTNRNITDAVFTAGSKVVTSATAAFTQDDVHGRFTTTNAAGFPTSWTANRQITDLVFTNGSTTVTSATGNFTAADKGKQIAWGTNVGTDGGYALFVTAVNSSTSITISSPWRHSSGTKSLALVQPMGLRIERVVNSTTAWLTQPAVTSGSSGTVTIRRPRPGLRFESGGASTLVGSLNVVNNSGPGLEFVGASNHNRILSLTGDNNGGPLMRIRDAGNADACHFDVYLKTENNSYGSTDLNIMADHPCAVGIDGCGSIKLHIHGDVRSGLRGSFAVVRIDRSNTYSAGFVAVEFDTEGANPYNVDWEYEIYDTDLGKGVQVPSIDIDGRFWPKILWNIDLVTGGNFEDPVNISRDLLQKIRRGTTPVQRLSTESWRERIIFGDSWPNYQPQGAWNTGFATSGWPYNVRGFSQTGALNDEFHWVFPLSAGTWRLDLNIGKRNDGATVSFDFSMDDGATWTNIGTIDTYSAAEVIGFLQAYTGITIPATGKVRFRAKLTGRNASNTTGYQFIGYSATWTRTA